MKRKTKSPSDCCSKPPKSKPALKFLPSPRKTRTGTPCSCASSTPWISASTNSPESAFILVGRFSVKVQASALRSMSNTGAAPGSLAVLAAVAGCVCAMAASVVISNLDPEAAQHFIVVFAKRGRAICDGAGAPAETNGRGKRFGGGAVGQIKVLYPFHVFHLRVFQHIRVIIDGRARHARISKRLQPFF